MVLSERRFKFKVTTYIKGITHCGLITTNVDLSLGSMTPRLVLEKARVSIHYKAKCKILFDGWRSVYPVLEIKITEKSLFI